MALELPWLPPVPMGAAVLKQFLILPRPKLPVAWSTRQTLGKMASDSIPDLPGSPRLRLMDDPVLSLPPFSKCGYQQGLPPACLEWEPVKARRSGRLVGLLLVFSPSFHPAALPVTPRSP